jgi:hypothetical protein
LQLWIPTGEQSSLQMRIGGDGKRFVVHADEKLTAFLELETAIRAAPGSITTFPIGYL